MGEGLFSGLAPAAEIDRKSTSLRVTALVVFLQAPKILLLGSTLN